MVVQQRLLVDWGHYHDWVVGGIFKAGQILASCDVEVTPTQGPTIFAVRAAESRHNLACTLE